MKLWILLELKAKIQSKEAKKNPNLCRRRSVERF